MLAKCEPAKEFKLLCQVVYTQLIREVLQTKLIREFSLCHSYNPSIVVGRFKAPMWGQVDETLEMLGETDVFLGQRVRAPQLWRLRPIPRHAGRERRQRLAK